MPACLPACLPACCLWTLHTLACIAAPAPDRHPARPPHPPLLTLPPCAGIAEDIGRNLLVYGRRMPKAELFARIDAVDAATVKAVANRFILDQDVAISAMGDTQVGGPAACEGGGVGVVVGGGSSRENTAWCECWGSSHGLLPPTHPPTQPCLQFLPDYTWMRRRTYWLRY